MKDNVFLIIMNLWKCVLHYDKNSSEIIISHRVTKFLIISGLYILEEQLHLKDHTDSICNRVNKRLGLLALIRSCLTLKAAKCVYK